MGFETNTLDMEGNVTKRASFDHVTAAVLKEVLPSFTGTIQQVPPLYSAIRQNGKKLYQSARQGRTADEMNIPARAVKIYRIQLVGHELPKFELDIECGGGTYIRSLIRDIGIQLGSVATMTYLERTKQGPFTLEQALEKNDWTPENIYAAIDNFNLTRKEQTEKEA